MALPGISFEIVDTGGPVLGIRSDRTAMIALSERGREAVPTLVRSPDEYLREFGCPVDGMLGPLAAALYFDNGGQHLIVTRFVPDEALAAGVDVPIVEGTGTSGAVPFVARDRGAFGNRLVIQIRTTVRRRARGELDPDDTITFSGLSVPLFEPPGPAVDDTGEQGLPVRVVSSLGVFWTTLDTVGELVGAEQVVTLQTPPSWATPIDVIVELYEPTFALQIRDPGQPDIIVPDLDLRDPVAMRATLDATPVTVGGAFPSTGSAALPMASTPFRLDGGSDGLHPSGDLPKLEESFRAGLAALEASNLPDIVIAPDLWSRVVETKGVQSLAFTPEQAIKLGDELARSAERTRDRVVLLDPPLAGPAGLRPASGTELVTWRTERATALGAARDFAAAYSPWTRIVAGPVYRGEETLLFPPSAAIAGQIARTSRVRGPWIATGNVPLEGVVGLDQVLDDDTAELLQDFGINPLRMSLPRGATIFGVRSLSWPDRKAWRFLSVRRLFNYLRRALNPIGLSYVFEANAPATWISLRRDVERLMRDLFSAGALAGSQPAEAFFVKIDETLNPEEARQNGVLTAEIGLAPAKPLEFLVVRLMLEGGVARLAEEPIIV
jgi:hypothetical protein